MQQKLVSASALFPVRFVYRILRRLNRTVRHAREFFGRLRVKLVVVEGRERHSGEPLSFLYTGNDTCKRYLAHLVLGSAFDERPLGGAWLWHLSRAAARSECPLILIDTHPSLHRLLGAGAWFHIPRWIRGYVPVPCPAEILRSRSVRSDLSRIRRNALEYEVTRDDERYRDFYEAMHVPYVRATFGDLAFVLSYEVMRDRLRAGNGELLLVKAQGEYTAGIQIEYLGDRAHTTFLGIRDANTTYVAMGAMAALYLFSFQYLERKGFDAVHIGMTRPFLHDGVLVYKKKWGMHVVEPTPEEFALHVRRRTAATDAFLLNNPFICRREGRLFAAIFRDPETILSDVELQNARKEYGLAGLSGLEFFDLSGQGPARARMNS